MTVRFVLAIVPLLAIFGISVGQGVQAQVFVSEPTNIRNNWSTFAVLNRGETVPLLGGTAGQNFSWNANHALWDGLGAYRLDADSLRVYINHEVGTGSVSRLDLNVPSLQTWIANRVVGNNNTNQIARPSNLLEGMDLGWQSVGAGDGLLNRPCSGNVWESNTFGAGKGFSDRLYLAGEETFGTNPTGHYWAIDTANNVLYEAPSVGGFGSWENATLIDTGRTDTVALLLGEDRGASGIGTGKLSLYVGQKNSNGNFLERNGLVGGTTYYWDANGTGNTNGTLQAGGLFVNNNDKITGTWTTNITEAVLFSKAEDVHTNMQSSSAGFGKQAVLGSQDQAVFLIDFSNLGFISGALNGTNQTSDVKVLFKAGTDQGDGSGSTGLFGGMDNLVWSEDGNIYVNEDDGEGDIWKIKVSDLLAQYGQGNLTPNGSNAFQILDADPLSLGISESSGIIDISRLVGYIEGSIFLTNGMGSAGDQLALLVSPTATAIPEPSSILILVSAIGIFGLSRPRARNKRGLQ